MMFSQFIHIAICISTSSHFVVEQYSIVLIYHIFFIHLFIDGYLCYLHLLTIVNSAATNIHVHFVEHLFSILWGIYLRMDLLDHIVFPCLSFWGTANCFPQLQHNFRFLLANVQGCQFLHIHTNTFLFHFFVAILVCVKWYLTMVVICISHLHGIYLHFIALLIQWPMLLTIILYAYWPFVYPLEKCSNLLPIF